MTQDLMHLGLESLQVEGLITARNITPQSKNQQAQVCLGNAYSSVMMMMTNWCSLLRCSSMAIMHMFMCSKVKAYQGVVLDTA
jgi:hypothetical protein